MTRQPLELGDVLSGRALLALHDVELDALAFGERLVAVALDRRMMDEAILLTILGRDEAKALRIVEPLYRAGRTHCGAPKCLFGVSESGNAVLADQPGVFVIYAPTMGPPHASDELRRRRSSRNKNGP